MDSRFVWGALVVLLLAAGCAGGTVNGAGRPPGEESWMVLPGLEGGLHRIPVHGQPSVILFSSPHCLACERALIDLERIADGPRFEPVSFFAVLMESTEEEAVACREKVGSSLTWIRDPRGEVVRAFGVGAVPTVVLFDETGREVWRKAGYRGEGKELKRRILRLEGR